MWSRVMPVVAWLRASVDLRDALTALGVVLIAYGVSYWSGPGACIVAGVFLVWTALPSRPPFIGER